MKHQGITHYKYFCWTEDNRLQAVKEPYMGAYYNYDASGERNLKLTGGTVEVTQNGTTVNAPVFDKQTLYASALITINDRGYTKHYFEEGKRICSKIGGGELVDVDGLLPEISGSYNDQLGKSIQSIRVTYGQCMGVYTNIRMQDLYRRIINTYTNLIDTNESAFYYHGDHLGSASYITGDNGQPIQCLAYMPFGEDFVDIKYGSPTYETPYKFNGKEKDTETGYNYYGARYYTDYLSIFLSTDPMSNKYPSTSSYAYCANNPIKLIDPDGQEPTPAEAARMAAHVYGDKKNGILTGGWRVSSRDFGLTGKDLINTSSGLKSSVYERVVNGKVTEYTYATAGTEASWKDVGADLKQPFGLSKQYAKAADNAKTISGELGSAIELTYVGHSLGGGEAALNALVTNRKAITFNAAGVSDITKFVEGTWKTPFKSESKIDAYIMATDPLNNIQNNTSLPDVNGNRHYLTPTDASSIYNGHSMDNVLKNFEVKNPDEYNK